MSIEKLERYYVVDDHNPYASTMPDGYYVPYSATRTRENALLEQLRNTLAAIDLMVGHSVFERVVKEANDTIRQIESTQ